AQSVLFVAIFYGINVIWERDLGIVQKFLASPPPRAALVLGKGFSAGVRTLSQAAIVYGLSLLLGVKLNWSPLALLNVLVIVVLAATLFSTFSLTIACIVRTRERFMGVGQVLTMPLFFASNAIYPTAIMPGWLKVISHLNPLTYVVDALRTFMLAGSTSRFALRITLRVKRLSRAITFMLTINSQHAGSPPLQAHPALETRPASRLMLRYTRLRLAGDAGEELCWVFMFSWRAAAICGACLAVAGLIYAERPFRVYRSLEGYDNIPLPPDYAEKTEWVEARLMYPQHPNARFARYSRWGG